MPNISQIKNVGAYLKPVCAYPPTTITASGANNNAVQNGLTIDRLKQSGKLFRSMDIAAVIQSSMSSKAKTTLTLQVQDSPTSTAWTAFGSASASPIVIGATNATGAQTVKTAGGVAVDISGARRYIRINLISNQSTNVHGKTTPALAAVLGGADYDN